MSKYLSKRDLNESILKETALIMLEAEEPRKDFGSIEAWELSVPTYVRKMTEDPAVIS